MARRPLTLTGALTEPMSCLSHGWDRVQPVPMGSRILVQGAGIIGALWLATLHHMGHRNIIVSEPNEARRAIVKKLGRSSVICPPRGGNRSMIDCTSYYARNNSVITQFPKHY